MCQSEISRMSNLKIEKGSYQVTISVCAWKLMQWKCCQHAFGVVYECMFVKRSRCVGRENSSTFSGMPKKNMCVCVCVRARVGACVRVHLRCNYLMTIWNML